MQSIYSILGLVFGYICGSIISAVIVCRLFSLPDPRTQGSGNPGTTNVLRIGGKKLAALTLAGDLLKGLIPVLVLKLILPEHLKIIWLLAGFGAFLGHIYPIFANFKGGKGVATAAGVLLAWDWRLGLICITVWIIVFAITKLSSLSALFAAFTAVISAFILNNQDKYLPILVLAISCILVYRHQENIQRLLAGTETSFSKNTKKN